MIVRARHLLVLSLAFACGREDKNQTERKVLPAEEEIRVLGEEEDGDQKGKGSENALPAEPIEKLGSEGEGSESLDKLLDLSKIENLVYNYNETLVSKTIRVAFDGDKCQISSLAKSFAGTLTQCLAIKASVAKISAVRYRPGAVCDEAIDHLILRADGLEQKVSAKPIADAKKCTIPELAADEVSNLTEVLKSISL